MEQEKKKSGLGTLIVLVGIAMLAAGLVLVIANCEPMNMPMVILGAVIAVVGLILFIYTLTTYNKMVKYRNKVEESLSLVDVQLKQRFDMIPNLVNTVKGYAKHEKEVFSEIAELRNIATTTTDEKEKIECANKMLPKIRQIVAIAENYPKLKADALFANLMDELVLVEDKIVAARRFYDSNVNSYNTLVESMPSGIIAKMYGFARLELFAIETNEKMNVKIDME